MEIRHFSIDTPAVPPPDGDGWVQSWYGYYHRVGIGIENEIDDPNRQLEIDCFLSVVADIKSTGRPVRLMELGAGWGEWCMALAGVMDYSLVPTEAEDYRCVAVEGEPYYHGIILDHFLSQEIQGQAVLGAVTDKDGDDKYCRYNRFTGDGSYYCQGMTWGGNFGGSRLKTLALGAFHTMARRTVKVPVWTIDHLLKYSEAHLDILHMDIQGTEIKAIMGAKESIAAGRIDYMIIGTHHPRINQELRAMLLPWYNAVLDEPPPAKDGGLGQDGLQLWKRKGV
ncbi:hypothetical protein LCGC14_0968600 [marine sediment metagenome]|uniref:Methyltransferase FkbM domain-containing protein n=1 Tax=marine sediment metagenome TaxID=412755 RepID=A0A0F9NCD5_9ZZZZ